MSTLTLFHHDSSLKRGALSNITTGGHAGSAYGNTGRTSKNEFADALKVLQQGASGNVQNDVRRHLPINSYDSGAQSEFADELAAVQSQEPTPKLDALREKFAVLNENPSSKNFEVLNETPQEEDWSILDKIGDGLLFAAKLATRVAVGKLF